MFDDINQVILVGGLVRHELRYTTNGKAVLNFTIATNRSYKIADKWEKETEYVDITTFRNADTLNSKLKKGTKVYVQGRLKTDTWETQEGTRSKKKVMAERVELLHNYIKNDTSNSNREVSAKSPEELLEEMENTEKADEVNDLDKVF